MELPPLSAPGLPAPARSRDVTAEEARMRETAEAFEASFLADVLANSGINAMPDSFGGGAGEDAFSSLLTREYGRLLAERGGVGLAEQVFDLLKQRSAAP